MPVKAKDKAPNKIKLATPVGRLSFPYLVEPDVGRQYSDKKYKTDLLISKDIWKKEGQTLKDAVLKVGRTFYKDKSLELSDFTNPFKDTDELPKYAKDPAVKGCMLIRAKSEFAPTVVGPVKINAQWVPLTEKELKAVKGGDYARLVVVVYPYSTGEGGVTLGLNLVQYQKAGAALGGGLSSNLELIDEMEVEADDIAPDEEEDEDDDSGVRDNDGEEEEEEEPAPKPKGKRGRPAGSKGKKKAEPEEDEEEDGEFSFDDDEDEAA